MMITVPMQTFLKKAKSHRCPTYVCVKKNMCACVCLFLHASISLMPFPTPLAFYCHTAGRYIKAKTSVSSRPSVQNNEPPENDIPPNNGDLINANKYLLSIPHLIYTLQHKQTLTQPLIYA